MDRDFFSSDRAENLRETLLTWNRLLIGIERRRETVKQAEAKALDDIRERSTAFENRVQTEVDQFPGASETLTQRLRMHREMADILEQETKNLSRTALAVLEEEERITRELFQELLANINMTFDVAEIEMDEFQAQGIRFLTSNGYSPDAATAIIAKFKEEFLQARKKKDS